MYLWGDTIKSTTEDCKYPQQDEVEQQVANCPINRITTMGPTVFERSKTHRTQMLSTCSDYSRLDLNLSCYLTPFDQQRLCPWTENGRQCDMQKFTCLEIPCADPHTYVAFTNEEV